jgi:hypothetical protein
MNSLAALKQQLMKKPINIERKPVEIVIKERENVQIEIAKEKPFEMEKVEENPEEEIQEEVVIKERIQKPKKKMPKIIIENDLDEEDKTIAPVVTEIVNEIDKGFDRERLLKRLNENNKLTVITKPVLEVSQEKEMYEPIIQEPIVQEPMVDEETEIIIPMKKKVKKKKEIVVEEVNEDEEIIEGKEIAIKLPKKTKKHTKLIQKGIAVIGPEMFVDFGDTEVSERIPYNSPKVLITAPSYYMNNREKFINFINNLFQPYKDEIASNRESISCDIIGKTNTDFALLTHQKIVRDYINLYTPYRGLLLYHGLGSGKTCTSIAIAEGMKNSKKVIIMTPASLQNNYREELKKCGDLLYKRNQFWEWVSIIDNPDAIQTLSTVLNLPMEFIRKNKGAFFINITKEPNYDSLTDVQQKLLEDQLNEMINTKYTFINYNGLRSQKLSEMTNKFTRNIFDNAVIIIDEAHNLISSIVNKLKMEDPIPSEERKHRGEEEESIFGDHTPLNRSTKLYYMLLRAKNARIILLTGTPIINYPNEFAILFNILRGYIKTWKIQLNIKTTKKIDTKFFQEILFGENSLDYVDYSSSNKILTITRNPFGFQNKFKERNEYRGVSNVTRDRKGKTFFDTDFISDEDFEKQIIYKIRQHEIDIIPQQSKIINNKALPDDLSSFILRYINESNSKLINVDALKRRIIGLSSYFKSAQESLLPRYTKTLGIDYHVVRIPMSNLQFQYYEEARKKERDLEKTTFKLKKKKNILDLFKEQSSTYRIFSRLFCNFIIPDRPIPQKQIKKIEKEKKVSEELGKKVGEELGEKLEKEQEEEVGVNIIDVLKQGARVEKKQENDKEGEVEGDEILENIGGEDYKKRLDEAVEYIKQNSETFLTPAGLSIYSPKFLHILENIQREEEYAGLHLVYSQFRTAEGIGLFSIVLEANGFARFRIAKNRVTGIWEITIPEKDLGKPTFALYTGTESSEEKEFLRRIYNGEWDNLPESISSVLKTMSNNNNMGEIIKVFMITSSGSEGINLKNTRYVHIMEPYWHPVRLEQVIGRARRICSHKDLDEELRTVEVFVYLMIFTEEQLAPGENEPIQLKLNDLSKALPRVPITSDQYLYEISEIKANLTSQLTDVIKESAFDCYIYTNNGKCVNFGDPTSNKMSYVPDYADQENDKTVQANKVGVEWKGKLVTIGTTKYISRQMNKNLYYLYDVDSYHASEKDPSVIPLQLGTLEKQGNGQFSINYI